MAVDFVTLPPPFASRKVTGLNIMKKFLMLIAIVMLAGTSSIPASPFTPGNIVVYRVGDGAAALAGTATFVFLDEYTPAGALVQSVAMPTAVSSSNRRLTATGNSTSEGNMTLSVDGQFLMLTGYDADVGTATPAQAASATVNRVVGRVDGSGTIDTTTALSDAYSGTAGNNANIRGVISTDGNDIWTTGTAPTANAATAGIRYTTLGSTTTTQLSTTQTNLRATNIFGGQLYVSAGLAALRLGAVGTGTPTTSGQTITSIPGFPTVGGGTPSSPSQFFFADLDSGVAGVDTLYISDDTGAGSGVQKYSLVGGTWTANGFVALATTRGLTGSVSGSSVTLYVTNGGTLQTLTDTSGYNSTINGTFTSLATAGANTAFRGVAFVPGNGVIGPVPQSAVSRKTHGAAGDFDLDLPLTGPPGIECRTGGPTGDFTMIVTFAVPVTVTGSPQAEVTSGAGTVGTGGTPNGGMVTVAGDTVIIPLTSVTNAQTIHVTLSGVQEETLRKESVQGSDVVIPMSILLGDANGNAAVNATDVSQTKSRIGQPVSGTNFRSDVNANGSINAGDAAQIKANIGNGLP